MFASDLGGWVPAILIAIIAGAYLFVQLGELFSKWIETCEWFKKKEE